MNLWLTVQFFFTAVAGSGAFVTQRVATADNPAIPTFSEACSLSSSTQVPTILFKRKSLVPGLGRVSTHTVLTRTDKSAPLPHLPHTRASTHAIKQFSEYLFSDKITHQLFKPNQATVQATLGSQPFY